MMIETKALKICIACAFIVLVGVFPAVTNDYQIEVCKDDTNILKSPIIHTSIDVEQDFMGIPPSGRLFNMCWG